MRLGLIKYPLQWLRVSQPTRLARSHPLPSIHYYKMPKAIVFALLSSALSLVSGRDSHWVLRAASVPQTSDALQVPLAMARGKQTIF